MILALGLALVVVTGRSTLSVCPDTNAESSSYEFASNPWLNLSNFLVKQGKHLRGIEDDGLGARGYISEDTAAVRALTPSELTEWNSAVEFFARIVVPDRMGVDNLVLDINEVLARTAPNDNLDDARLPADFRRVLQAVMPIYRSAWWPNHDRRNREWLVAMKAALAEREACLVRRAEVVFRAPWPTAPIHVDASVYASWFGAYSIHQPTRITVSANARASQGNSGLEILLHETAHGMLGPLDSALTQEAERQQKKLPRELSHLVLFYTAGAVMREQFPDYVPYAEEFGVWRQNSMAIRYRAAISQAWQAYLSGACGFAEAVAGLVQRLP